MQVTEIYKSIQGESSFAGLPCIFVRLTGCNLRCSWCDSEYTFTGGHKMTPDEVHSEVEQLVNGGAAKLLELTGGEPMLQEREVIPLMHRLLDGGYTVLLETSGERPLAAIPKQVIKIVDVKCPHSGAADTFRMENLDALEPHDELNFVVSDWVDYEFARGFIRQHDLASRVNSVILSPAFRKDAAGTRDASQCLLDPRQLAEWMLQDALPARLGLQMHKFVWDPARKGV
jgi:7-carboxy-7-deazaguanine synthase